MITAQDAYKKDGEALETDSDVKSNQAAQDAIFKTADALKQGKQLGLFELLVEL